MKKIIATTLIFLSIVGLMGLAMDYNDDLPVKGHKVVVVEEGETLWDISSNKNKNLNTHKVLGYIKEKNDLEDVIINPGQELEVPLFEGGDEK